MILRGWGGASTAITVIYSAGIVAGFLAATLFLGCTQIDILVEKNLYVENSEEVDVEYITSSDIDAELKNDLQDLLDLKLK